MAIVGKFGNGIIIDLLWYRKAVCENRAILRDTGFGWRQVAHLKEGVDWKEHARKAIKHRDAIDAAIPELRALRTWLDKNVKGYARRSYLKAGLDMMSNDPDGLWAEFSDNQGEPNMPDLDIDECVEVCRLYENAVVALMRYREAQKRGGE